MAKRMTDTGLWKSQRWFRKLPPNYKLAFCYIKDQSDHAGLWNIDCSDLIEDLGFETFNISEFVDAINTEYNKITGEKIVKERLLLLRDSMLWITGFIQFQYEGKDKVVGYISNATRSALWVLYNTIISPLKPLEAPKSPQEGVSLLEYGITHFHIKVKEGLPDFVEGLQALMDKDKDKDKSVKQKKSKNEKQIINFRTQGEELFAARDKRFRTEIE